MINLTRHNKAVTMTKAINAYAMAQGWFNTIDEELKVCYNIKTNSFLLFEVGNMQPLDNVCANDTDLDALTVFKWYVEDIVNAFDTPRTPLLIIVK